MQQSYNSILDLNKRYGGGNVVIVIEIGCSLPHAKKATPKSIDAFRTALRSMNEAPLIYGGTASWIGKPDYPPFNSSIIDFGIFHKYVPENILDLNGDSEMIHRRLIEDPEVLKEPDFDRGVFSEKISREIVRLCLPKDSFLDEVKISNSAIILNNSSFYNITTSKTEEDQYNSPIRLKKQIDMVFTGSKTSMFELFYNLNNSPSIEFVANPLSELYEPYLEFKKEWDDLERNYSFLVW